MFIDHFAVILVEPMLEARGYVVSDNPVYTLMRAAGRIAFPLFCFMLVEGMEKTRNKSRYLGQLFLMAIISEPCFDFGLEGVWWDPKYQNVCVTLFIGGLVLMLDEIYERKVANKLARWLLLVVTAIGGMAATYLLKTDYSVVGIAVILTLKYLRPLIKRDVFYAIIVMMAVVYLSYFIKYFIKFPRHRADGIDWTWYFKTAWTLQLMEPVSLLFISAYNAKKGRIFPKLFYYSFYPVHFILLGFIAKMLGFIVL